MEQLLESQLAQELYAGWLAGRPAEPRV
jgi:hypothetical protein